MSDFKTLVKDFYESYDPESYSQETLEEMVKTYDSDPNKFLTDFYKSYDPKAYSEESNIELLKSYGIYKPKKKSQEEPTVSTSSDGESPSKEVEPTAERSELSEADRLKAQETSDLFNTFTPMEDPNDSPMPSEENFSLGEEDQQKLETQEAVSFPTETEEEYAVSTVDNIFKGDDKIDDYLLEKENPGPVNDAVISKYYKTLSEYYGSDRLEEIKKKKEEEGLPSDIAKDVALNQISKEAYDLSMTTRNLSEEEITEYSKDVNIYADLMSKHSDEGGLSSDETNELVRANSKIREIRDGHDLVNPLTGNIDKAYTEKIGKITEGYKKEKDFSKLKTAYLSEYNKMGFIYSEFEEEIEKYAKQEEDYNERTGADKDFFTSKNPLQRMLALKNLKDKNLSLLTDEYQTSTDEEKQESELIKSKVLEYEKSFNKYLGISSALLFNVDPGTVNRGFKFLNKAQEGDFVNSIGKFTNALSETFKEEMSGRKVFSDRDFAKTYAKVANENGIKTTPDQVEALKNEFSEDLGDATGITSSIMLDIIASAAITRNASSIVGIPKAIAKIKALKNSPRLAKVVGHLYEGTMQGTAFAVADERTGFAMGATEYGVGQIFQSALNAVTKGTSSKLANLGARLLGRGFGGGSEEYLGEAMDKRELFELGVFDEKLWDLVLGASEDEAWKKFAITAIMSFGFGTAGEVSSFISNNEDYIKSLDGDAKTLIEELVDANKAEQQSAKSETTGDLETDVLSDQKKIKSAENKAKKRAAKDKAQEERAKKIEDKNLELKLNKEKSIGEETLVPLTEEVDIDGKTFLTTEGETDVNTLNQEEEIDIDVEEINEIRQKNTAKKESTLESNLDKPVSYKGEKGVLKQEGQQIVFELPNGNITEFGNITTKGSTPLSDITDQEGNVLLTPIDVETKSETTTEEELTPEETTAEKETTIKKELTHEGVDYTIENHKVNKKGESILTVKEVDTGLTRKLKGDVAEKGRLILEEANVSNAIKAEEVKKSKERVKQEEQESSDFNKLLAEEEYNKKTEEELEIEEAKSKEEVAKFEEELTDVITKEQKVKKEKGLVISEGGKKFLVRQKADGTYSVAAIRSDGKTVAFTGKTNLDARNKLIERFKDKVSTSEDIALQEGAALSEEFKKEQEDKILNFLDKAIDATSTKGRAFDATLGIPLTISNGALKVVKASYLASKNLAEAIASGMAHIKKMNYNVDETKFTDFVLDSFSGKKLKGKTQKEPEPGSKKTSEPGSKKPPVKGSKDFKKGRQEGKKEVKALQDSFGEFVKGKTKEIRDLSPKLTATVLKKAALLKTEKGLASAKAYVEKVLSNKKFRVEEAARSNSLDFIGKALERKNWKKKGKNEGKISIESQEFLQKAAVASKLTREQANEKRIKILSNKAGQELTEDQVEDLQALTFSGLDNASQYDLDNATQLIKEYQKSGREQLRAKKKARSEEYSRLEKVSMDAITDNGTKKIIPAADRKSFRQTGFKGFLKEASKYLSVNNGILSWNSSFSDLLNMINYSSAKNNPKGREGARSTLEEEFYEPVIKARLDMTTAVNKKKHSIHEAKIKIWGDSGKSYDSLTPEGKKKSLEAGFKKVAESRYNTKKEIAKEINDIRSEFAISAETVGIDTSKKGWESSLSEDQVDLVKSVPLTEFELLNEEAGKRGVLLFEASDKIDKEIRNSVKANDVKARAKQKQADKKDLDRRSGVTKKDKKAVRKADEILNKEEPVLDAKGKPFIIGTEGGFITKAQAITIYNWAKNEQTSRVLDNMKENGTPFQKAKIDQAMKMVSSDPKLIEYADWTVDFYKDFHPEINKIHEEAYEFSLPQEEYYTPVKRFGKEVPIDLELLDPGKNIASTRNGSLENRVESKVPLDLSFSSDIAMKEYIEQMQHFIHFTKPAKILSKGLTGSEVSNAIEQTTGGLTNSVLQKLITDITMGSAQYKNDIKILSTIRANMTTASIGGNVPVTFKQLTSIPAYMAEVNTIAYIKELKKIIGSGLSESGKKEFMQDWNDIVNSDFLIDRLSKGYDVDTKDALNNSVLKFINKKQNITNALMSFSKYGDVGAIIVGGLPFYRTKKRIYEKTMSKADAKKKAMLDFVKATKRAQQSSDIEEQTALQRSGEIGKMLTSFKTSPRQYLQKVTVASRNIKRGRGTAIDYKRIWMFGVVLPALFTATGKGMLYDEWDEDDLADFSKSLFVGNLGGIGVFGDMITATVDKVQGKNWDYKPSPALQAIYKAFEGIAQFTFSEEKDLDKLIPAAESATGLPVKRAKDIINQVTPSNLKKVAKEALKGELNSIERLIGFTEGSLESKENKKKNKKSKTKNFSQ